MKKKTPTNKQTASTNKNQTLAEMQKGTSTAIHYCLTIAIKS